jgi:hypothetical protein
MHTQADSKACLGCSGNAQASSPSAQVKAAAAHVQRLKDGRRTATFLLVSLSLPWFQTVSSPTRM